ncbi:hypothetical protein HORIV_62050 [Vreelandella olivaria]|uniref:Uncharacterized protein n=1 Tax=Vreelandella olivaria TaxID=390919 RepID=A0ABM7GQ08_9GAMM|nr:hypothetical protein HORIV_62050 [Halomonas olivaria]
MRGIAELNSIVQLANEQQASERHFNAIIRRVDRTLNQFHWIGEADFKTIHAALEQLKHTAELMLDEYEKVQAIRAQTAQALDEVEKQQAALLRELKPSSWKTPIYSLPI